MYPAAMVQSGPSAPEEAQYDFAVSLSDCSPQVLIEYHPSEFLSRLIPAQKSEPFIWGLVGTVSLIHAAHRATSSGLAPRSCACVARAVVRSIDNETTTEYKILKAILPRVGLTHTAFV